MLFQSESPDIFQIYNRMSEMCRLIMKKYMLSAHIDVKGCEKAEVKNPSYFLSYSELFYDPFVTSYFEKNDLSTQKNENLSQLHVISTLNSLNRYNQDFLLQMKPNYSNIFLFRYKQI